jgi:hypothetical protein
VTVLANPLAIGIGLVMIVVIMAMAFVGFRSRRDRGADLGEVSSQWVMEHRMGPGHDSSRWNQR